MNARSHPRPIRMSGAGHCPRRQAYQSLGYPPSNPPDAAGRNRMALGDACETLIIHGLLDDGWTVQHTQATPGSAQLEIVRRHPPMTGHPDGVCRHPDITGGSRLTLEAKSMSPELLDRVIFEGIENVYPEYLDQAAIYSHHLYAHQLIDEPNCAVFATMDREGRPGPPQLVRWPEQHVPQALERLERDLGDHTPRRTAPQTLRSRQQPLPALSLPHRMPWRRHPGGPRPDLRGRPPAGTSG